MATLTVRKLPDDVHEALIEQAKRNGRSTEAEVRSILTQAVSQKRERLGDALLELGSKLHSTEVAQRFLDSRQNVGNG